MHYSFRLPSKLERNVAVLLIASLITLGWANIAHGAQLTTISDTLADSDVSSLSNHTFLFTTPTGVALGENITLTFPTGGAGFSFPSLTEDDVDIADDGVEHTTAADCTGSEKASVAWGSPTLTITICAGDGGAIAAGSVIRIKIGTNATSSGTGANRITNGATPGTRTIAIDGSMVDSGNALVAVIDDVDVSAAVNESFTFTISAVASAGSVNGDTTNITTTSTTVPFGVVAPDTTYIAAQLLAVTTNATNGFTVTVQANQTLTSGNGADIDLYKDGAATSTPESFANPTGTLGSEATYGHWGLTSEDSSLSGGDTFGAALYAGNFVSAAREIFYHTGPADGTTDHVGDTKVGYKLRVTALQEAANDYTSTLTYVATPIF